MNRPFSLIFYGCLLVSLRPPVALTAQQPGTDWLAGISRVDITPREPVRMAGYGNRDHPSEGVETRLFARCLAVRMGASGETSLMVSIDTIGLPGTVARQLARRIEEKHGIPRERIVLCSTHTHAGPDLVSQLSNIFSTPLTDAETEAGKRYRQQLENGILDSVDQAIETLAPSSLSYAVGNATFAANRRVLKDGRWTGFGVQPDGPVDHTVPVLRVCDATGNVRGIVFNYACHCTTLGGDYYKINADWAGYASSNLEATYPEAVALCTIGCGADANPEPRGTVDAAKVHGRTLAAEVGRILQADMKVIDAPLATRFDYAALTFDLPTAEELQARLKESRPQTQRHASQMLAILKDRGRLAETYPVPIQSWRFGDQLTMIFIGGEVVVDYALRLKKQLDDPDLWVTAYANDVLGYIASERMRFEGGYEYDRSGIYYGLPGPWAAGTEDNLIERIESLVKSRGRSRPSDPDEALRSFHVSEGFVIELVAAEPLVQDPINIAFDIRGRLWVVEMGDYPEGENGGRVKILTDRDGDGIFDDADEFLAGLPYPTGVFPWRDGVLVSAAPDVLFVRDEDGDGKADIAEKLYTGFRLANPQHRINGFTYGLDHSLHLASGDNLSTIKSVKTGDTIDASGHDVQIWPDTGRIAATSGRTQYVRSRSDWGEWFGNDNSRPMYQFPIDDRYLQRNPAVRFAGSTQQLFDPPVAPRVYPVTPATERFNDLFAANRFTSACSSIVARSPVFEAQGEPGEAAFICEPVHNLVHRAVLRSHGEIYRAERSPQEKSSEFLASSDPWFRPVRALIGPDGCLYVVDMYRETIEHPQWIPEAWQGQLDLRAGSNRGRIYRVREVDRRSKPMMRFDQLSTAHLVQQLRSENGALRDLAQQWIVEKYSDQAIAPLVKLAGDTSQPKARVHALSILQLQQDLSDELLAKALQDSHPGVLMVAIRLAESRLKSNPGLLDELAITAGHSDQRVVLQTALALGQTKEAKAGEILASIATNHHGPWVSRAISSSAGPHVAKILQKLSRQSSGVFAVNPDLLTDLLVTARANGIDIVADYGDALTDQNADLTTQLRMATSLTAALGSQDTAPVAQLLQPLYRRAVEFARDGSQDPARRCEALELVGIGIGESGEEKSLLLDLIAPATPVSVQQKAVDRLSRFSERETCTRLVGRWPSMSKSVRDHCVSQMMQRRSWAETLLASMESGAIQPRDLTPAARQQLRHTGSRSMRVRAQRLTRNSGSLAKREIIQDYVSRMERTADTDSGAEHFKRHCAVCHIAPEGQTAVGASLNNLTDRSDRALLTAILDPNHAVDPRFQSYVILTDEDRVLVGAIEEEVGSSITLAHADGKRTTIQRSEIVELKNSGVSLMPEGFEEVLPPAAMRDLIGYLQETHLTNLSPGKDSSGD